MSVSCPPFLKCIFNCILILQSFYSLVVFFSVSSALEHRVAVTSVFCVYFYPLHLYTIVLFWRILNVSEWETDAATDREKNIMLKCNKKLFSSSFLWCSLSDWRRRWAKHLRNQILLMAFFLPWIRGFQGISQYSLLASCGLLANECRCSLGRRSPYQKL